MKMHENVKMPYPCDFSGVQSDCCGGAELLAGSGFVCGAIFMRHLPLRKEMPRRWIPAKSKISPFALFFAYPFAPHPAKPPHRAQVQIDPMHPVHGTPVRISLFQALPITPPRGLLRFEADLDAWQPVGLQL